MFHAGGHKGMATRGRSRGIGGHYPHFLSHVDWKAPLRCGIVFCTLSCVLFVVGVILTWLGIRRSELNRGVHDVFGESVPITGPILLAVGGLMLILAVRQFYMAHTRKRAHNLALAKKELGDNTTEAITDGNEEHDFMDANADRYKDEDPSGIENDNSREKPPLIPGGYCDSETINSSNMDPLSNGGYIWPPVPFQHPYYSMAMMVYKDTFLNSGMNVLSPGLAETYNFSPAVATSLDIRGGITDDKSRDVASSSLSFQQQDSAMLTTPSTTLQHQTQYSSTPLTSMHGSRQECSKIFPADYLKPTQYKNATQNSNSAVISNLPNPTAFMMIRTLELQETI